MCVFNVPPTEVVLGYAHYNNQLDITSFSLQS